MTKQQRIIYLQSAGWIFAVSPIDQFHRKPWIRPKRFKLYSLLGAFAYQQAADARAEREAEGR